MVALRYTTARYKINDCCCIQVAIVFALLVSMITRAGCYIGIYYSSNIEMIYYFTFWSIYFVSENPPVVFSSGTYIVTHCKQIPVHVSLSIYIYIFI